MPGVIPTFYPIDFTSAANRVVAISQLNRGEAERPAASGGKTLRCSRPFSDKAGEASMPNPVTGADGLSLHRESSFNRAGVGSYELGNKSYRRQTPSGIRVLAVQSVGRGSYSASSTDHGRASSKTPDREKLNDERPKQISTQGLASKFIGRRSHTETTPPGSHRHGVGAGYP